MLKGLIITMSLFMSVAKADVSVFQAVSSVANKVVAMDAQTQGGLNWKVGDSANYNINAGFISGTMVMSVRSIDDQGAWIDQDMDLGFAGKQKESMLIDMHTGQIKKVVVNGKEQDPPKQDDYEMIDSTEDHITVPAGAFDCIHFRVRQKKDNTEVNQWVNPQAVPIMGLLKTIAPSQMGDVTVELTSFHKN